MESMKGTETVVDSSLREIKNHGTNGFPMAVYLDDFSHFENGYICWHWHEEVQMTLILEGDFTCQAGNEKLLMHPGDMIFINRCVLHQICPCKPSSGKLYSFIWKAELLAGNTTSDLYQHCIAPILQDYPQTYLYRPGNSNTDRAKAALLKIVSFLSEKKDFYQLRIYHLLSEIWLDLCDYPKEQSSPASVLQYRDDQRVKTAMEYMQNHFGEAITLEDIAKATMISRSELCKSFRRALDTTPKDFLLQYRIRQAILLLGNHELRISDIAEMTGFSSPSHFGSCFAKACGCTPHEYRKQAGKQHSPDKNATAFTV